MAIPAQVAALLDESEVDERTRQLVTAAFAGEEALAATAARQSTPETGEAPKVQQLPAVHLNSIEVEGFRGVGKSSTLLFDPKPGLTLVIGRNGSGKSSFAEGLEVLLTGSNLRWEGRSKAWEDGWRNLHHDTTRVSAEFAVEGTGSMTASRAWPADGKVDDCTTQVETGKETTGGISSLGWDVPLDRHRPFLSYNELGSMLEDRPSDLYDAVSAFLGLDDLIAAQDSLASVRKTYEAPGKDANKSKKALAEQLAAVEDDRATEAIALLKKRALDMDALRALAASDSGADDELQRLKALANLSVLATESLESAADELAVAIDAVVESAGTDAGRANELRQLLELAQTHTHDTDDETCPVCGTEGVITKKWHSDTTEMLQTLATDAANASASQQRLNSARRSAQTAIVGVPAALQNPSTEAAAKAHETWSQWCAATDSDTMLVERLRQFAPVATAVTEAKAEAATTIAERDLGWRPHGRAIENLLDELAIAEVSTTTANEVKAGEEWVKDAIATIRSERFEPIADQSRTMWEALRHRSNVELEAISLEGANTNRRLELNVKVDGEPCAALGVMSQGELHALALSLFLPRATMPDSPFRFLVIDDPVQAMDPARVDGLANVLGSIAKTHQVVVFTHDDRLPESVRRLQIPAEVTEVSRQPGSLVTTRAVFDPVSTAVEDARAVAYTETMHEVAIRKVVPAYCRLALEAAATTAVRRRRIGRGEEHRKVEELLVKQSGDLRKLMALAIFDDAGRSREVNDALGDVGPIDAKSTLHWCNAGAHGDFDGDPKQLTKRSEELAKWLLERS